MCIFKDDNFNESLLEEMKTILRWQNLKVYSNKNQELRAYGMSSSKILRINRLL